MTKIISTGLVKFNRCLLGCTTSNFVIHALSTRSTHCIPYSQFISSTKCLLLASQEKIIKISTRTKRIKTDSPTMTSVKIGIICGSGLDNPDILESRSEKTVSTPYGETSDILILGKINGVDCVLLSRHGRDHSVTPSHINFRANIWALKNEGCTHVIATSATGSLQEHIQPGDIVILDSFIDWTKSRVSSFYDGAKHSPKGICHLPMEPAFCNHTRKIIMDTAKELGIKYHDKGTCVAIEGPRFSSKAESLMFRKLGGDLINMTTIPEVVLAKEAGLCYATIALATDYDCWRPAGENVSQSLVVETFKKNVPKVIKLITTAVKKISTEDWTSTITELKKTVESSVMLPNN